MSVEMVKTVLNDEYEIILPKHRADREQWHTEEGWEKKRLAHIKSTTKPGDVVYYVGAEEGDMCALLAQWGAHLVLFEPNDKVWPNTRAIWEANGLPDPVFFTGFASDKTTFPIVYGEGFADVTGEVIPDHGFKELRDPDTIPQVKIDDFVKDSGLIPDMITMDTEGSEGLVLRGAEQTLRDYHPRIYLSLHPEFLHEQYGEWGAELRRWIIDLGYKETLIDYPLHECHLMYSARSRKSYHKRKAIL